MTCQLPAARPAPRRCCRRPSPPAAGLANWRAGGARTSGHALRKRCGEPHRRSTPPCFRAEPRAQGLSSRRAGPSRSSPTGAEGPGPWSLPRPAVPVSFPAEDSPSGLGRTLGKRVGGNPSGVRISYPPPLTRQDSARPRLAIHLGTSGSLIRSLIHSAHIGIKRPKSAGARLGCCCGCGRPLDIPGLSRPACCRSRHDGSGSSQR